MKKRMYDLLQRGLHRFGIYTQYYPSAKAIHNHLENKPANIQNYELNKLCDVIKATNNHKFYNSLLKLFVPQWKENLQCFFFIPVNGAGGSSLDVFRKVKIDNVYYFEKIYNSASTDIIAIIWFNEYVLNLIERHDVKAPRLYKVVQGDAFTITYSKFFDLKKIDQSNYEINLISLTKKLYQASTDKDFKSIESLVPEYLKDFKKSLHYKKKIQTAKSELLNYDIRIDKIEYAIMQSKLVLSHGDLHEKNIFKDSIAIDWDTFGIYPIGYDVAFIHSKIIVITNEISDNWLEMNFRDIVLENDWQALKRNYNYFLYIFLAWNFSKDAYKELERQLVENLKQYS